VAIEPTEGCVVVIAAFDDIPQHLFQVAEVLDDHITGVALSGPLRGCYGEPDLELVLRVHAGMPNFPASPSK
jgi:hypothetical protein